jgi:hypothetical protein
LIDALTGNNNVVLRRRFATPRWQTVGLNARLDSLTVGSRTTPRGEFTRRRK